MGTFILKRKIFFDFGITSKDISDYAFGHNLSTKDAYEQLKTQRSNAGVAQTAFKDFDKSTFKGSVLRGSQDAGGKLAQGVTGVTDAGNFTVTQNKTSAAQQAVQSQQAHMANDNRWWADKNKQANLRKQEQAFKKGQKSVLQGNNVQKGVDLYNRFRWNNMGTFGKAAVIGGGALLGAKLISSMNNKDRNK